MPPSSAVERASKARMFEGMDARVRAGARSTSNTGKFRHHDVAETGMPGAMVFGDFLPKQKVTRSPPRRAEPNSGVADSREKQEGGSGLAPER